MFFYMHVLRKWARRFVKFQLSPTCCLTSRLISPLLTHGHHWNAPSPLHSLHIHEIDIDQVPQQIHIVPLGEALFEVRNLKNFESSL